MFGRLGRWLIGGPRDIEDPHLFHKVSLIAFLAWIGLGADGLSSSAYGPDEAYRALGEHRELAVFLALATALTVFIISYAYTRVIERFPTGGGGYIVATKLLGDTPGLVSGAALLIDYVLTITVSVASGANAVFAFLPQQYEVLKLPAESLTIAVLVLMNLRGVRESITMLVPIFLLFLATHATMFAVTFFKHFGDVPVVASAVATDLRSGAASLGLVGMFVIFARAFSQGAGTYTGIEAVSNGLMVMREPRVATAKRTMMYMALSLAVTAGGILLAYLVTGVRADPAAPFRPLNAVLLDNLVQGLPWLGHWFVVLTLLSEALLLLIAAQTGFVDGPRVMANMALDSWLPHRFSALSERLTTHYGVVLMGGASVAALLYTQGHISMLVVMYSVNVFITFSLTQLGMCKFYVTNRHHAEWKRALPIHVLGFLLCLGILTLLAVEKFLHGAWLTMLATLLLVSVCLLVRRYYDQVRAKLRFLPFDIELPPAPVPELTRLDIQKPVAVLLAGEFSGLGVHSFFTMRRLFPDYCAQMLFVGIATIDSGNFKGPEEIDALKKRTQAGLDKYVALAHKLKIPATSMMNTGHEVVASATELCVEVALRYPKAIFFAGRLVFQSETWYQRLLHNNTAAAIQNRLQWLGYPMVVLPIRIWGESKEGSHLTSPGARLEPDKPPSREH